MLRITRTIVALCLLIVGMKAVALGADREKDIHIQADSAVVDDKNGLSTYSGNVVIDQGTLHITADEVKIHSQQNKVVKVVASADDDSHRLAHYQQMPDNSENLVQADARQITWFVKEEKLRLVGDAKFTQTEESSFSGETIHYDANTGTVDAQSSSQGQVETIFKPNSQ